MTRSFTTDDFTRLEAASRAFLSPLASADVDAWRTEVVRVVRPLLGADHAMFSLSNQPRVFVGEGLDTSFYARFVEFVDVQTGAFRTDDPVSDIWFDRHRAAGHGVYTVDQIEHDLRPHGLSLRASPFVHEIYAPSGRYGIRGFTAAVGAAEAALEVTYARPGAGPPDSMARPLLGALLPSFRAGLDALVRLDAYRHALDTVAEPLVALDPDGRELHRNRALVRLLADDPEVPTIEAALFRLGADLRRL
ncbi:MAG TPA: hypothetical protein VF576_14175, partial [Rubricoccaceae bacterium]